MSSNSNNDGEQQFTIQPHPQTDHNNNLTDGSGGAGPTSATQAAATGGKTGPVMLDSETASKLEAPKSKEELADLSAKLNKD